MYQMNLTAQSLSVNINRDSVLLGNSFTIHYVIKNADGNFEAPLFNNMTMISGPNMSSSYQYINGESSRSKTYSYVLRPKETGEIIIDQAFLELEGQTLETDFVKIQVYPNPEGIIQEDEGRHTEFSFSLPWDQTPLKKKEKTNPKKKKKLKKI